VIGHTRSAPQTPVMEVASPDGRLLAGVRDNNLWLRFSQDGRAQQLTSDGEEDYPWQVGEARWSPDGMALAVTRSDRRSVLKLPILHWLKPTEEVEWVPYTKAGGSLAQEELHVVDVISRRSQRVDPGDNDQRLMPLRWTPDGRELLYLKFGRCFKPINLMAADRATGQSRLVIHEEVPTFLNYEDLDRLVTVLPSGAGVVWRSERDGWAHLYHYDLNGNLRARLTEGDFVVQSVVDIDEEARWVYFTAQAEKDRIYDIHVYRVGFEGSGFSRLTTDQGCHQPKFLPSHRYFLDRHPDIRRPPSVDLRTADGGLVRTLSVADTTRIDALALPIVENFTSLAADGVTELHGVLYKPHDFDPQQRYAVIDYIYGGPQIIATPRTYDDSWPCVARAIGDQGFVVLILDAKGTPDRGRAFHDIVWRKFGQHEVLDHAAALPQLAESRPWMDLDRVGIFGASWGGYMTLRAMLTSPETYHVGVSLVPVADHIDHWALPIEVFMDTPQENPAGYLASSCLTIAANLKGKLLLVAGASDINATFSAAMKMTDALIRAGKQHDLIVVPEQDHSFRSGGDASKDYMLDAIRRYFTEHLGVR
jgi:dipeptidyl aminopeptidase/acylaminoacyl peptidase